MLFCWQNDLAAVEEKVVVLWFRIWLWWGVPKAVRPRADNIFTSSFYRCSRPCPAEATAVRIHEIGHLFCFGLVAAESEVLLL